MERLIILLPFSPLLLLLYLLFTDIRVNNRSEIHLLKFSDFKAYYLVNPNRWDLMDWQVAFWKQNYEGWDAYKTYFRFSLTDKFRYRQWKRALNKQTKNEKMNAELIEVLKVIQEDAKKLQEKAERETYQGMKQYDTAEIIKRIEVL
jgi:16S rRNA C967 or C1407 C5-methylase (RsmB/RsmF family)